MSKTDDTRTRAIRPDKLAPFVPAFYHLGKEQVLFRS
jgi:hypothetical protein